MELNNRELAIVIWTVLVIAAAALSPKVREAFRGVIGAFINLAHVLALALSLAGIWIAACIWVLARLGLWEWSNLKTTLVWAIVFAFVTMLDVNRINEDKAYFRKTIRETINATVIVAFVAEFYAFSLPVELILIPFLTFTAMLHEVAKRELQYASVAKLCSGVLAVAGLTYVGYGFYRATTDLDEFATWATFREFIVPIILSLAFLPFIYLFNAYFTYDAKLVRLSVFMEDKALRRYAKWRAMRAFGLDLELLDRWSRSLFRDRPSSRKEICDSIARAKLLRERERNPPKVSPEAGWSPYIAKNFLEPVGLRTRDYQASFDDEWMSVSNTLELGEGRFMADNLTYYVEGNEDAAERLILNLNMNNPANAEASEARFREACGLLIRSAVDDDVDALLTKMEAKEELHEFAGGRHIEIKREEFEGALTGGYSKSLVIRI